MTVPELRALFEAWPVWAHDGQMPPDGEWRVWLMLAGRGFGKTRAGAEWVSALARARPDAAIALVGATPAEVERVMIRGASGLMAVARAEEDLLFYPTRGPDRVSRAGRRPSSIRAPIRTGCAGRSMISPGATSWRNGAIRRRRSTI